MTSPRIDHVSPRPSSGLLSAVAVPGGYVAVDLLDPVVPVRLSLDPGAEGADVPESWLRLAVVTGVDRWATEPVDEGILMADLGAAHAAAGLPDRARHFFERSRSALEALTQRVLAAGDRHRSDAVVAELARVVGAAPFGPTADEIRDFAAPRRAGDAEAFAADPVTAAARQRSRQVLVSRGAPGAEQAADLIVDPRNVPARLVGAERSVTIEGTSVRLSLVAYPGVDGDTAAVGRLMARATVDGLVVGLGALRLDDGTFSTRLPARGHGLDELTIDVFDTAAVGGPRTSRADRVSAQRISRLQAAFTWARVASAEDALGLDASIARDLSDQAMSRLAGDEPVPSAAEAAAGTGPRRPLLAELVGPSLG